MNTLTNFSVVWKNKNYAEKLEQNKLHYEEELVSAVCQERERLARELHDSVLQVFYGINMIAHNVPITDTHQTVTPMTHVSLLTETGINEVRALLYELRPDLLETEGLVTALAKRVELLRECYKLNVEAFLFGEPDISALRKHAIYCIAQEALHNIVKHARATTITLWLMQEEHTLILILRDDGKGFDPKKQFPGHFGLQSMRERVALLNGTLSIESAQGHGTALCVRLPKQD